MADGDGDGDHMGFDDSLEIAYLSMGDGTNGTGTQGTPEEEGTPLQSAVEQTTDSAIADKAISTVPEKESEQEEDQDDDQNIMPTVD